VTATTIYTVRSVWEMGVTVTTPTAVAIDNAGCAALVSMPEILAPETYTTFTFYISQPT